MGMFDDLKGKAEKLAADHPDQVEKLSDQAIEQGGNVADQATHGRHVKHVDSFQEKADDAVGS
jgi:methionine synthase I (cobalamin-dependent)